MSFRDGAVHSAIKRWAEKGIVSSEQAQTLHDETIEHGGEAGRRWSQFIVAGTGAVVLVIAAGTFLEWAWPLMGPGWQSCVLGLAGVGAYLVGVRLEGAGRWGPVGYFLQMAGPVTLLMALGYSGEAWPDGSPGGIAVGIIALAVPPITMVHAIRRNTLMPAVHAILGFIFLGMFLVRAMEITMENVVWILDGVLAVSFVLLAVGLARTRGEHGGDWLLHAFVACLFVGMVLVPMTAAIPLEMADDTAYPMDVGLAVIIALTLWGIHKAPPFLQRSWYSKQLVICVIAGTFLAMATTLGAMETTETVAALVMASVGAVSLWYSLAYGMRDVVMASCVSLIWTAWFYGVTESGALGVVGALTFTAVLLFWVSSRLGRVSSGPGEES
ncbi:hypothetical protein ACGF5M_01545 [Gemmatimonadota bacterium]